MSPIPGSSRNLRAGFLLLDPNTAAVSKVIEFPFNPATLSRELQAVSSDGSPAEPREMISFTILLDASDGLANRDPVTMELGVLPLLSALEVLLYSPPPGEPLLVFVWGPRRVLPVRISSLSVSEQLFDSKLNPIQVQIAVTLQSLKSVDLPEGSQGRRLWDTHLQVIEQLSLQIRAGKLSDLGLDGI